VKFKVPTNPPKRELAERWAIRNSDEFHLPTADLPTPELVLDLRTYAYYVPDHLSLTTYAYDLPIAGTNQ